MTSEKERVLKIALGTYGVPDEIISDLKYGKILDCWIQLVVFSQMDWRHAKTWIENNVDENGFKNRMQGEL